MKAAPATLRLDQLALRIGETQILTDVSMEIAPGEVVGLIGRSGSGKSLTGLSVIGLTPGEAQVSGMILIDGDPIEPHNETTMRKYRGRDISIIFQEPSTALNPVQPIGTQIGEMLRQHKPPDAKPEDAQIDELLSRVGLDAIENPASRYPHELSGGQRQRVMIAIAIAARPKLLIADEPTTALDVITQAEILALLKSLVDEDEISLLFISHDVNIIEKIADRVYVIADGRIIDSGTPLKMVAQYASTRRGTRTTKIVDTQNSSSILRVNNIVCQYRSRQHAFSEPKTHNAVDNVSLTIHEREVVALIGQSGCGKSTLARAICGLQPLQSGSIAIDERQFVSVESEPDKTLRQKIQMVFQDPYSSFNPRWSIAKIISEPMHLRKAYASPAAQIERVAYLLNAVGLSPDDMKKTPNAFSGGQRQRIAIARALATDPAILVLDEATSALDVVSRNQILDLLLSLTDEHGLAYLMISHDLQTVRDLADKIMIMDNGKIIEHGPSAAILDNPQEEYTKRLITAAFEYAHQ